MRGLALRGIGVLLLAGPAGAQSLEATVSANRLQSHTYFAASRIEQTGVWVGGDAAAELWKLRLAIGMTVGSLAGTADSVQPDRSTRVTTLSALLGATDWLWLGATAEARRFETEVGVTAWRLIGGQVRVSHSLGSPLLVGVAELSAWPAAQVLEGQAMAVALRTVVGVNYRLGSRVSARMAYRFERFDFESPTTGTARLDQFRGAIVGLTMRVGPMRQSPAP